MKDREKAEGVCTAKEPGKRRVEGWTIEQGTGFFGVEHPEPFV